MLTIPNFYFYFNPRFIDDMIIASVIAAQIAVDVHGNWQKRECGYLMCIITAPSKPTKKALLYILIFEHRQPHSTPLRKLFSFG